MKTQISLSFTIALALGACTQAGDGGSAPVIRNLPESIVAIAAPNQDLTSVRLLPEDGCYWYRHTGPVETTLLPLRNVEGRPICTRPAE